MPALTTAQVHTIEITALKGKAIASLLGVSSGSEACTAEDIAMTAYSLESLFKEILEALEQTTDAAAAERGRLNRCRLSL